LFVYVIICVLENVHNNRSNYLYLYGDGLPNLYHYCFPSLLPVLRNRELIGAPSHVRTLALIKAMHLTTILIICDETVSYRQAPVSAGTQSVLIVIRGIPQ
jgi:hypothetical protein